MSLENIVTSLELSQKLEQIGIKQDSIFVWVKSNQLKWPSDNWMVLQANHFTYAEPYEHCCAFTAQELWGMSDNGISINIGGGENIANCLAQLIIAQKEEKSE